jgi:Ca2+-binding EF-hand superfamily protein
MCFEIFDSDKSGFLSRDELMRLLTSNGIDLGAPTGSSADLGADESRAIRLAEVFSRMDTNHDQKISFDEFRRALHEDPIVAEAVLRPLREQAAR